MKTKLINHFNTFALMASVLVMLLSFSVDSYANSTTEKNNLATITGTVTDAVNGEALIGVTVQVKGSSTATMTDVEGKYQIEAQPSDFLVFTYTGMETQEIGVNTQGVINIQLAENAELVDEVVVIGYGKQKKSLLTGSISKVTNKNLDEIPISRVDDALAGQVAGVNIQMTNPAAGEAPTIRVRGQGSISFGSAPLIVVDGIVVGSDADFLSSIDMNDVSSVEVLKDAASSAIYGSRGANGIIMITTKGGKEGPIQLDYNTYVGFKSVPKTDVLTTVDAWADFVRSNNDGVLTDRMQYIEKLGTTTDWEDVMMDGGVIQSHALSARGGTKRTKFRASLSYLNDEGVLLTDNYEKINFRLNIDTKINDRLSFGTMVNPSYTEQRRFPIGVHDGIRQSPWLPIFLDENSIQYVNRVRENGRWADAQIGDYAMERMFDDYDLVTGQSGLSGTDISGTSNQSAYAKVVERDRRKMQTKIYSNTYMKFKLAKGLTFKQTLGGDYRYSKNSTWIGVQASRNGAGDSESSLSTSSRYHLVSESTLNYNRKFGEHTVDAVGGYAYESWNEEYTALEAAGFENDLIRTIPAANLVGASTARRQEGLISYLSRVNYTYSDKYLLSLSARWDGSSRFGPDNKYGFFPSAAVGWRISEENFLKDSDVIEELKARFSYGVTGNNNIGDYLYIGLIEPVGTGLSGVGTAFNPINISNSELRWEKLLEYNAGLDVSVLKGRIAMSLDLYNRTSSDLLLELPIPSVTGFDNALVNKGIVENKGVEVEVRTNNITRDNFTWSSSVLVTRNVNTLVDFADASGLVTFVDSKRPALWIAQEGQPISSFYGYVVKDEIDIDFINDPFYPINGQSQDIYVKDLNGDGLIDTDDRTILGSPYPDVIWSVNNSVRYNEFDLSFMFQGSHGAEVRNISSQYINNEFSSKQDSKSDLPNADQTVQRIFTNDDIQDASYVALRNLNLGYTLPSRLMSKVGLRKLRVYVSTQNLLYIMSDGYKGYNPEGIDQGLGSPLTYGYQRGPAPIYRTVSFGLNVSL